MKFDNLHICLIPPNTLCGATEGEFIDAKYIVQNKWKTRITMLLFGCRECGVELRRIMKTARPIR